MKKIYITLFSLFCICSAYADTLQFGLTVTPEKDIALPEYLDPMNYPKPNGNPSDFPVPMVKVGKEFWIIYKNGYDPRVIRYKGTNIENCVRQSDGTMNLIHPEWGLVSNPYLLAGMWFDTTDNKLYAPMHCEYPPVYGLIIKNLVARQIHMAVSDDTGRTWHYMGPIFTKDDPKNVNPEYNYSGSCWDGGDGDYNFFVDEKNGYYYLFSDHYIWPKENTGGKAFFYGYHVARCAMKDKMAPGKWHKFYNGTWTEPGLGGKASYVNGYKVLYSSYLKKYISFNYGSGISVCSDLTKQDWSPIYYFPGNYWYKLSKGYWELAASNSNKINIFSFDSILHIYSYFYNVPGLKYKLTFNKNGIISDTAGYVQTGPINLPFTGKGWYGYNRNPMRCYGDPLYDNPDSIWNRHVRKVDFKNPETVYTGEWTTQSSPCAIKMCSTAKSSVSFTFKGSGIYWRAASDLDGGKADIFLDGKFEKTVDFYGDFQLYQFWFVKTRLDSTISHTIKIVVRGDKNPKSSGTSIKHISFEYSTECYEASDGFCALSGKNNWIYQSWNGSSYANLYFDQGQNLWINSRNTIKIGNGYQIPDDSKDAVRKWLAPHSGKIRIEGVVSVDTAGGDGVIAKILHNDSQIWEKRLVTFPKPDSHDIIIDVAKGDAIAFFINKNGNSIKDKTYWNPVITYVH